MFFFKFLTELGVKDIPLSDDIVECIFQLPRLSILNMDHCGLSDLSPILNCAAPLSILNVRSNALASVDWIATYCRSLQVLSVGNNVPLSRISPLVSLPCIKVLDLSYLPNVCDFDCLAVCSTLFKVDFSPFRPSVADTLKRSGIRVMWTTHSFRLSFMSVFLVCLLLYTAYWNHCRRVELMSKNDSTSEWIFFFFF